VKVEFSPTALSDLEDIADDIARHNPIIAEQWVDKLVEAAEKIAQPSALGEGGSRNRRPEDPRRNHPGRPGGVSG
jgi:plasmid stabilization system protein ParE